MSAVEAHEVRHLVDHLFRHQSGRLVAALTRVFGSRRLGLVEEVVQEALVRALQTWPFNGVPRDPGAWLLSVARRRALDRLRREGLHRDKVATLGRSLEPNPAAAGAPRLATEVSDDQLRLVFMCCHPEIPRDGRVALTLKLVCGFGVREIAGAFLTQETTVAQRLVRAKRKVRSSELRFELPGAAELSTRLDAVLEVLYLLFGEGYAGHGDLVRSAFCDEALRLGSSLLDLDLLKERPERPTVHALMALMLFQASRLPARLDGDGNLVRLEEQDRSLWDRRAIDRAFFHFARAARGSRESVYHLQAAIAAEHTAAGSTEGTDWPAILSLYDRLHCLAPNPVITLNRAVALARVAGPKAGLEALRALDRESALEGYHLLSATRGRLLEEAGEREQALSSYRRALPLARSDAERRFLERRVAALAEAGQGVGLSST